MVGNDEMSYILPLPHKGSFKGQGNRMEGGFLRAHSPFQVWPVWITLRTTMAVLTEHNLGCIGLA